MTAKILSRAADDKAGPMNDTLFQERVAMESAVFDGDPDKLSRLELISLYINDYYSLDADARSRFEAAFRKRKLPLPAIPANPPRDARGRAGKASSIDRNTFISYMLLIYTGTAIFYSWFYLAARLAKMDFGSKHKLILSAISLAYIVGEIFLFDYFSRLE
jgi:hypothetical protein